MSSASASTKGARHDRLPRFRACIKAWGEPNKKNRKGELIWDGHDAPVTAPPDNKQGRQFAFATIEPWPTVVDGGALLDEISTAIRRYVIMPPHAAEAIALWIVHTHLVERFLISPRLALRSVTKQCGKTTTLDILARLVHRPLPTVNVTAAAIFRVVEAHRPCFGFDASRPLD